jgi:hypothetical protein
MPVPQDIKPRLNRRERLAALERLGPAGRTWKAWELTQAARASTRAGLRRTFPHLSDPELNDLYLKRLAACHNRNY